MTLSRLTTCLLVTTAILGLGACASGKPRPVAMDPGQPMSRLQAMQTLMDINDANAAAYGVSVSELRRKDKVCVVLATGMEVRPGAIVDFEDTMLSATMQDDFIDVRVVNISEDVGVYAASGCPFTSLTWNSEAAAGWGVFRTEDQARAFLDRIATALTTLGGDVSRRVRHDNK